MSNKQKIIDAIRGNDASMIDNSNHYGRRMFRLWLDGSYMGQEHYRRHCRIIAKNLDDYFGLRTYVASEFAEWVLTEFDVDILTAINTIKEAYPEEYEHPKVIDGNTIWSEQQLLVECLMEDARELVAEEIA
jgi:hypothetical protein